VGRFFFLAQTYLARVEANFNDCGEDRGLPDHVGQGSTMHTDQDRGVHHLLELLLLRGRGREGRWMRSHLAQVEVEGDMSNRRLSLPPSLPPSFSPSLPTSEISSIRTVSTFPSPPSSRKTRIISSKLLVLLSSKQRVEARSTRRM